MARSSNQVSSIRLTRDPVKCLLSLAADVLKQLLGTYVTVESPSHSCSRGWPLLLGLQRQAAAPNSLVLRCNVIQTAQNKLPGCQHLCVFRVFSHLLKMQVLEGQGEVSLIRSPCSVGSHWSWITSACSGLERGLGSQPETEAGTRWWKHQNLATRPAVSDKGPGL